jgi:hypothetical protein
MGADLEHDRPIRRQMLPFDETNSVIDVVDKIKRREPANCKMAICPKSSKASMQAPPSMRPLCCV